MRIALVSPYSWTFPGGVTRHIDALARGLLAEGHHVRVLSPVDPDDRLTRALHRRAPDPTPIPDYVVSLGRTASLPMNGASSHIAVTPESALRLRAELRAGAFDVIHVHEPIAPMVGWDACTFDAGAPVVEPSTCTRRAGCRTRSRARSARAGCSTGCTRASRSPRRRGGRASAFRRHVRHNTPNGVDTSAAPHGPKPVSDELQIVFVGREEERKGLPVLLSAFAGLRQHIPVRLQVIGSESEAIEPLLAQVEGGMDGIEVLGRVDDAELWRRLHAADVLCAPSLGGESFGMVLTEAFAAGTPVVASEIAGYRQVVTHGRDGLLVTPGDPLELAHPSLWLDPVRRAQMSVAARERAEDFAWPQVARQVESVYRRAVEAPDPVGAAQTARAKAGLVQGDLTPSPRARRLPSIEPGPPKASRGSRTLAGARRAALGLSAVVGVLLAFLALRRVGFENVLQTLVDSSPIWVLIALALFSTSMILRAVSWFHIVRAALPEYPVKRRTILSATSIGVLMSATLPARLGEPSRALIVARRIGRMRESLPVVAGTLVSQTLLNLLALFLLAVVVVGSNDILRGHEGVLLLVSIAPVGFAAAVLVLPSLMEAGRRFRFGGGQGAIARLMREGSRGARALAQGTSGVPPPAARGLGHERPARRLGPPAAGCVRVAAGARPRQPRRYWRCRRGAVRGQRDRGAAGHAVEHRRLPACGDHRPDGRLRRAGRLGARLRPDPAGGRGADRNPVRAARADPRGRLVARRADARARGHAGGQALAARRAVAGNSVDRTLGHPSFGYPKLGLFFGSGFISRHSSPTSRTSGSG